MTRLKEVCEGFDLDKSLIKVLCKPRLDTPIFVQSLSLPDQPSSIITGFLIEHTKPEKIAEFYSPYFQDYAAANDNGLCTLPHYEFHATNQFKPSIILLTGEAQPLSDDAYANYEVFTTIFNYARELGCRRFISYRCFKSNRAEEAVYIAATSGKLASNIAEKLGGKVFNRRRLVGSAGLILGLARSRGLRGLCFLKPVADRVPSEVASVSLFNYLLRILELKKE